mgnify:CR=1 FL=1
MSLTPEQVRHVAHLARLAITPEEEERYARQLNQVLAHVDRLAALDVSRVEPLAHAVPLPALLRDDVVTPSLPREDVLANAPQRTAEGVAVPKIIE